MANPFTDASALITALLSGLVGSLLTIVVSLTIAPWLSNRRKMRRFAGFYFHTFIQKPHQEGASIYDTIALYSFHGKNKIEFAKICYEHELDPIAVIHYINNKQRMPDRINRDATKIMFPYESKIKATFYKYRHYVYGFCFAAVCVMVVALLT